MESALAASDFHGIDAACVSEHERRNALHLLVGMMELARQSWPPATARPAPPAASSTAIANVIARVIARVSEPLVRALLVGKIVTAMDRGVRLDISDGSSLPGRCARPGELVTILGNLIDNAVDALLEHPRAEPWVEVEVRGRGAVTELRVTDNGPGVPPGDRQWIFASGSSTKRPTDGRHRGLGLAIVRRIVRYRGGTVSVTGIQGGGAVFTVRLPADPPGSLRRAQ